MADAAPEAVRRAAWAIARDGDPAGADRHLSLARLRDEDRGESWFATGLLRIGRDDDAARSAFIAAARARFPPGPERSRRRDALRQGANRYAALEAFRDDFAHDFCCFAVPRAASPAERQGYGFCMERACAHLGPVPAAPLLEADRALNGETHWLHVNLGHRAWIDGRRAEADAHYGLARKLALREGLLPCHFNCGALVWLARDTARALIGTRVAESVATGAFNQPRAGPAELAIVVGCDPNYFVFLPKLLLSVATAHRASGSAMPVAVHCRVCDPTERQAAFLREAAGALAAASPLLTLGWSAGPAAHRHPDWYTGLRFLALPDVLAEHRCGAVALDVDCELLPAFFEAAPGLLAHEFAFRMYTYDAAFRQVAGEPWSIGAHPTFVADTPAGRRFASFLPAYLHAAYDPSLPTCWTIDQCAIAQGFDLLVRPDPGLRVLNLARAAPTYRLPQDDGGKAAFLNAGGAVTLDDFADRLARAMSR